MDQPSLSQTTLAPTAKQVGSVPAAGSGPGAAKLDEQDIVSANTVPPEPLTTGPPSLSPPQATLAPTTKQIGSVPAVGSGPGATKIDEEDIVSANTKPPEPLATAPSTSSFSGNSSTFIKQDQSSIATISKQVGKVPAVGSGPEAATLPAGAVASANTEPPVPLSTASPAFLTTSLPSPTSSFSSFAKTGNDSVATTSKQIGIVPAVGSGPEAATPPAAEVASANTVAPESFSTTAVVRSKTTLSSILRENGTNSSIVAPKQTSSPSLSSFSSGQAIIPQVTSVAGAGTSNIAMAKTFNQFFDSMNANSNCNPDSDTQRMVCIDKKTAQCGADGKYTLSPCSQGLICRAVPLDETQAGIAIRCVSEADTIQASPSKSAQASTVGTPPSQTPGQTPLQAEPTKTKPLLSSVIKTTKATSAASASSSPENRPPTIIISTQTQFVTIEADKPSASPVPAEPKTTLSASPQTSEIPAIIIVPESRKSVETNSSKPTSPSPVPTDTPPAAVTPVQALNFLGGTGPVTVTETETETETVTVTATVKR